MMRYLRGMVLLGVSATLWACNTEPDALKGGDPVKIVATPQTMFIVNGATKSVLVRLVDAQGGALTAPVTITDVGPGISVAADSGFRPIYNAAGELVFNEFNNELRLLVTATGLAASSFTVEAGGLTNEIAVTVLPEVVDAPLSNLTPAANEVVTLTAPDGFTFTPTTAVNFATGAGSEVVSLAADGKSIDFLPFPGSSGTMTLTDVSPDYAPSLRLELENLTTLDIQEPSPFSSDDPGTTPTTLTMPALGETLTFVDFAAFPDQFWDIETTEDDTRLDIVFDWGGEGDIDVLICNAVCNTNLTGNDGRTGDHPETITVTLATAGHYTLYAHVYSGSASYYRPTITRIPLP